MYKIGDQVKFTIKRKTYKGIVNQDHIEIDNFNNDTIFRELGIKDKYAFCKEFYKITGSGGWPTSEIGFDKIPEKITACIEALQALCDEKSGKVTKKSEIWEF